MIYQIPPLPRSWEEMTDSHYVHFFNMLAATGDIERTRLRFFSRFTRIATGNTAIRTPLRKKYGTPRPGNVLISVRDTTGRSGIYEVDSALLGAAYEETAFLLDLPKTPHLPTMGVSLHCMKSLWYLRVPVFDDRGENLSFGEYQSIALLCAVISDHRESFAENAPYNEDEPAIAAMRALGDMVYQPRIFKKNTPQEHVLPQPEHPFPHGLYFAAYYWAVALQGLLAEEFSDIFGTLSQKQKKSATDKPSTPRVRDEMLAMLRLLTGGDVTKNAAVSQVPVREALTEVAARIKENKELQRQLRAQKRRK